MENLEHLEVGFDIPAKPGMAESEIQTPALILDLEALERNIRKLGAFVSAHGLRHRAHAKMHKSIDVARVQQCLGGASGVCCQKVSEAEVFARGGIKDVLLSNQVRDPVKIARLAKLPLLGGEVSVCVDDLDNVAQLSAAAVRAGTQLSVLVEVDCGAGRCGVSNGAEAVSLARAIAHAEGLHFGGIQAYQGALQHIERFAARQAATMAAISVVQGVLDALEKADLQVDQVTGAGTGSHEFEAASGIYTELQCGSYAFMDAHYGRLEAGDGARLDQSEWENALFVQTSVMSHAKSDRAVVDAGLKALTLESGMPVVFDTNYATYVEASDEHGVVLDPDGRLKINDRLKLVPGHCDPTCNLHDWYVGVRNGVVECVWPVSARGKVW